MTGMRSCTCATSGLASPTMIAADRSSLLSIRVNSHRPAKAKGSRLAKIAPGLLSIGTLLPLIKAGGRDETAAPGEGLSEQRFLVDGLCSSIDVRNLRLLFHPGRHQAPSGHDQLTLAVSRVDTHDGNLIGRRDV